MIGNRCSEPQQPSKIQVDVLVCVAGLLVYIFPCAVSSMSPTPSNLSEIATSGGQPILLRAAAVTVILRPQNGRESLDLGAEIDSLRSGERIYLLVKDPASSEQPGVLFHLYLDLPAGTKPAKDDIHYIGSLNFFAVIPGSGIPAKQKVFRSYDITDRVGELRRSNQLTESTTVTIIPSGSPSPNSHPTLGKVEIVKQAGSDVARP